MTTRLARGFALAWLAASTAAAGEADSAIARARALIERETARTLAPGVSIAVARDGRLLWSEAIGCADLELQAPMERTTRLRIGSVSKPLTAAALGRLVEDGRLDLDAPVQRYVPDFPKKAWPVTTRELAGHLAGVRHYEAGEFEIRDHYASVRSGLAIFERDALLFEPGTRFSYSSYGWNLISAVLEAVSGEPFLELMRKTVFDPAGLVHTAPDDPAPIVPGRARFDTRDEKGDVVNAGFVDNSYKWAGGGFVSTAEDLVSFAFALLDGRLLKPETVRLLWTSQKTSDGTETGYGLGWSVKDDEKGRRRVYHSGGAQGGTAFLVIYPRERLAAAMIVNSDESFTGQTLRIAEMFLDGE
ncbi:MAG: serine hydrolase domain-containing protein [Syntrophomonadaceae bacterium]